MFGGEEEEEAPKRKLIKLQYTEEEQRAMEAAQKQVRRWPLYVLPALPAVGLCQDGLQLSDASADRRMRSSQHLPGVMPGRSPLLAQFQATSL